MQVSRALKRSVAGLLARWPKFCFSEKIEKIIEGSLLDIEKVPAQELLQNLFYISNLQLKALFPRIPELCGRLSGRLQELSASELSNASQIFARLNY